MKTPTKPGLLQLTRLNKIMPKQDDLFEDTGSIMEQMPELVKAVNAVEREEAQLNAAFADYNKSVFLEASKEFPQAADRAALKGTAIKFDTDKLPLNLLSTEAMNQTAAVLKFGAIKYAEHNWRNGFQWSRPLAAAMRHLTAFNDGEDRDPESGLSHLAHAACCIMFLLEFEKTHKELDDRYKPNVPQVSKAPE